MPYQTEMAQSERESLKPSEFVFPKERKWPINTAKQAMTALTWSTWPQHKAVSKQVRDAVFKKYPELKKKFKGGKYESRSVKLGDVMSERFEELRQLIAEAPVKKPCKKDKKKVEESILNESSGSLLDFIINQTKLSRFIEKLELTDEQSANLLYEIYSKISDRFDISSSESHAISLLSKAVKGELDNSIKNGNARNLIFKAAHGLGIKLPSSMF